MWWRGPFFAGLSGERTIHEQQDRGQKKNASAMKPSGATGREPMCFMVYQVSSAFFRCCGLRWRFMQCRLGGRARTSDLNVFDFHRISGPVTSARGHARDLLYQFNGCIVTLAEDGMPSIQVRRRHFSDEEL